METSQIPDIVELLKYLIGVSVGSYGITLTFHWLVIIVTGGLIARKWLKKRPVQERNN